MGFDTVSVQLTRVDVHQCASPDRVAPRAVLGATKITIQSGVLEFARFAIVGLSKLDMVDVGLCGLIGDPVAAFTAFKRRRFGIRTRESCFLTFGVGPRRYGCIGARPDWEGPSIWGDCLQRVVAIEGNLLLT
jgi:hypothetical protein